MTDKTPANQPGWAEIVEDIEDCYELFNDIKVRLKELYGRLGIETTGELAGKRQPKIVKKLFHFPGDITPPMLRTLAREVEELGMFTTGGEEGD